MTDSVNMSEREALLRQGRPVVYSGNIQPIQGNDDSPGTSKSLANSEYLVRRSKEGFNSPGIPIFRAIFVVMNGAMGAGILNFPSAFAKAGGVTHGMIIQVIMLFFIIGAFLILAYCADKCGAQNFQQIVRGLLGPKNYVIAEILVLIYMIGTAVAYMVLIADQLEKVGEAIADGKHWYVNRNFLQSVVAICFLLPLCLPKHMGVLSYTSTAGGIGVAYICFVACYKYFYGTYNSHKVVPHLEKNFMDYLTVIPTICFGYQVHVQSVSVYAELRRPTVPRFALVCVLAMLFCCTAYSFTACFGYLTFGQKVKADFLVNYNQDDIMVNVARVVLALVVFSSYATCAFCGRQSIEGMWTMFWRMPIGRAQQRENVRRIFITVSWVVFSLLCSIVIPDVDYVISIVGGIAALFILFYPGICMVVELVKQDFLTTTHWVLIVLGILYVTMGIMLFGESEVLAIQRVLKRPNLY